MIKNRKEALSTFKNRVTKAKKITHPKSQRMKIQSGYKNLKEMHAIIYSKTYLESTEFQYCTENHI